MCPRLLPGTSILILKSGFSLGIMRILERFIAQRHFRPSASLAFQRFNEFRVRQGRPYHERRDHEHEYVLGFAVVPFELELGEVAVQVLHTDLVEAAYDAAFQQAPTTATRRVE